MSSKYSLKMMKNEALRLCNKGLSVYVTATNLPETPVSYVFNQTANFLSITPISTTNASNLSFAAAGITGAALTVATYKLTKGCFNLAAGFIDKDYKRYNNNPKLYKEDEMDKTNTHSADPINKGAETNAVYSQNHRNTPPPFEEVVKAILDVLRYREDMNEKMKKDMEEDIDRLRRRKKGKYCGSDYHSYDKKSIEWGSDKRSLEVMQREKERLYRSR